MKSKLDIFVALCRKNAADALQITEERVTAWGSIESDGIAIDLMIDGNYASDEQLLIINAYVNKILAAQEAN